MPLSENAKKNKINYNMEYNKKNYKRVSLLVSPKMYDDIKSASAANNESINGYIKTAVINRMENEKRK